MRDVQTQAEMIAIINAGGVVTYKGRIIRRVEDVPDDAQILLDYPLYAYTRIEGNSRGILGYEIYGTPADGDTLIFDGTDLRWEFGAGGGGGGGGGTGTVNSGTAKRLAFYPSTGTAIDDIPAFEYDVAANWNLKFSPAASKTGFLVSESGSTPSAFVAGSSVLSHLHASDASTYWALGYSSDSANSEWGNYINDGDGSLIFYGTDSSETLGNMTFSLFQLAGVTGDFYAYPNALAFAGSTSTQYGGIGEISSNYYGLMITPGTPLHVGTKYPLTWRTTGVTQFVPGTALADGDIQPNHLHFFIDEASDTLRVKWKESGGTVLSSILLTSALGTTGSGSLVFSNTPSITTPHISGTLFVSGSSGIQFGDGGGFSGATTGFITPVSDGVFRIGDSAGGGSPHIIFGSNSSSFVRVKRNGTTFAVRLGDDSGDANISAASGTFSNTISQSSSSATAFRSGATSTTPSLLIDNSTANQASGIAITGKADGTAPEIKTISRTQVASSIAGNGLTITADSAIAGSTNAGAAAGGSVNITGGSAARLTSGNANGGDINLAGGAPVGTGIYGSIWIRKPNLTALDNYATLKMRNPFNSSISRFISFYGPDDTTEQGYISTEAGNTGVIFSGSRGEFTNSARIVYTGTGGTNISNNSSSMGSGVVFGWTADFPYNSKDLVLRRSAAAYLVFGNADTDLNSNIVAQTLGVQGALTGGTADQAGKDWTFKGSQSKGTGNGGGFIWQVTPAAGSTSNTLNSYVTALALNSNGLLQFGGTTSSFPALKRSGTGLQVVLADDSGIASLNFAVVSSTKASSYSVAVKDSGTVFDNQGVTGNANFLLPTAAKGLIYTFIVSDADGLTLVANTGNTIRVGGSVSSSGGTVDSATVGNSVTIVGISSTQWYATSVIGTWNFA